MFTRMVNLTCGSISKFTWMVNLTCGSISKFTWMVNLTCGSISEFTWMVNLTGGSISKTISSACFYHLPRLRQLLNIMSSATMQRLICAFVVSRLDYCNSVLAGLPAVTLKPLQRVMNAAVRLVAGLGWRSHHTSVARSALAADRLSNNIQTMHPNARSSEQEQSGIHHRYTCS